MTLDEILRINYTDKIEVYGDNKLETYLIARYSHREWIGNDRDVRDYLNHRVKSIQAVVYDNEPIQTVTVDTSLI